MKITRDVSLRVIGCVCTALFTLCTMSVKAQQAGAGESPDIIYFKAEEALRAEDAARILTDRLYLNAATDELRSFYIQSPGDGIQVQRFHQYFKGIRVAHGTYTLTSKNGIASFATGKFFRLPANTSITPVLSEALALNKALVATGAERYMWQDTTMQAAGNMGKRAYYPKGSLTFAEDFTLNTPDGRVHLAYVFDIYATKPLSRNKVYVDAQDGKILFTDAILKHASGNSLYSGNVTFPSTVTGTTHSLRNTTNGMDISTFTLGGSTNTASAVFTTSSSATFSTDPAIDAHWATGQVYDYWKNTHNRASWDGFNTDLESYVHYGVNYSNAFWDGQGMFYGDGASNGSPFTTLDICGHEIGHGVCQSTADLVYSRESGAMNEGFSDIWGAVIENYADPHETDAVAKNMWICGEEMGNPLRDMSNPKQYGDPDTYQGFYWTYAGAGCNMSNDNCGVHSNSGVLNYWFYLLVTGRTGTNDVGNAYSVPGIGIAKAAKIAYNTELALSNTANYNNCRLASIAAATALYGACSKETEAVTRAWYAVNVGGNYSPCTPQVSFSAPTISADENGNQNSCVASNVLSLPIVMNGPAPTGGNAVVTVTPIGGTAVSGVDYSISSATVTFTAGSTAPQAISITILDNGALGTNKYIDLALSVSASGSNVTIANVLDTVRVIISSDDRAPEPGGTELHTALAYTADGNVTSPYQSAARASRIQYIYSVNELRTAGLRPGVPVSAAAFNVISKFSTQAFTGYTLKLAHTTQLSFSTSFLSAGFTTVYSANTTTTAGWNTMPFTTPFIWDGVSSIAVEICFTNATSGGANDRVQANAGSGAGAVATGTANGCNLPFSINNVTSARPVLRFTQDVPPSIADTMLHDTRSWDVRAGQQVYFYDSASKNLIAAVLEPTIDAGCLTTTITASGNGFVPAVSGGVNRSLKEFSITAAQPPAGPISFDGIFYMTTAELGTTNPATVRIVQTTSANDAAILPSNTEIVTPGSIVSGMGYTGFRGTFKGFNRFFLTDGSLALGVGTVGQAVTLWTGANPFHTAPVLYWNLPASERVSIRMYDVTGKLVYGAEQILAAGTHQMALSGNADLAPGSYVLQVVRPSAVFTRQLVKQ